MVTRTIGVVVELPAVAAEIAEAAQVATEIRTSLAVAAVAHRVLQIRINLHLNAHVRRSTLSSPCYFGSALTSVHASFTSKL